MVLFGASGHGKVIAEILESNGITDIQFWDDLPKTELLGYEVKVPPPQMDECTEVIISIGNNKIRKKIAEKLHSHCKFISTIHPSVSLSTRAVIGNGTVVMAKVTINSDASIAEHCIINSGAVVEHDCILESYVHISPNAILCGNVFIGEGTHIGAGATVIPGVKIGKWCNIGAGAVIIRDVPDCVTVVGNPGKIIKNNI